MILEHDLDEKQNLAKESSFVQEKELEKHSIITNSFSYFFFPKKTDSEIYSGTMPITGCNLQNLNQKNLE